jgi:hypothetical protein
MAGDLLEDGAAEGALEAAAKRLERAVGLLQGRVQALQSAAGASAGGLFEEDRSQLAEELDASRSRERALEEAGTEASAALGRAIAALKEAG